MSTKYALKINSDFTAKEILEHTKIFNCDEAREYVFRESHSQAFLSHTIINLNVSGASVRFIGRYQAEENLCDVSCVINHKASQTKSEINIRGIAKDGGKIISRSNIMVDKNLKNIIGEENAKFIFIANSVGISPLLMGGAGGRAGEIDAIPALDINSHDVSVNHSLSISKIKEIDIWYSNLHGLSEQQATDQFVESFLI